MKGLIFVVAIVLLFTVNVYATGTNPPTQQQSQSNYQNQDQYQGQSQNAIGVGIGIGVGKGGNAQSNATGGNATGGQGGAGGGGGSATSNANNSLNNNISQTTNTPRNYLPTPEINPIQPQLIQGITDVVNNLPSYDIPCQPLEKGDKVKLVLKVNNGGFFTSIRLHEIDQEVMDGCSELINKHSSMDAWMKGMYVNSSSKVRYRVWVKPSSKGAGIGGGATMGVSDAGSTTGYTSALGILPGFARSTVDPAFVIIYYLVK